ncbi:hypothetical protein LJR220_005106 [Bradyrhizobium sp. LjRoot220]|uniref:hypothetical protein n=1 Tax=Bradyrhizobium sp. LjRoot220 TaxID=3342284 RepID=UPI003ECDB65D
MINGRKNAVIGLTAIFTFALVELAAVVATVALVLQFAFDVDLPIFASRQE